MKDRVIPNDIRGDIDQRFEPTFLFWRINSDENCLLVRHLMVEPPFLVLELGLAVVQSVDSSEVSLESSEGSETKLLRLDFPKAKVSLYMKLEKNSKNSIHT